MLAEDDYDGTTGYLGYPQYQAWLEKANGDWVLVNADELYYAAVHAAASSEVQTYNSSDCPTLTSGSPWQDFGTDASGKPVADDYLQLEGTSGGWSVWTGSPVTNPSSATSPFYYNTLDGPAAIVTNGPSSGPAS
jgi:hypothetical protein